MAFKTGDFIELEYTGKIAETNTVFDTTNEQIAKNAGIYSPKAQYAPTIICLGEGMLLRGLDTKLLGKEIGAYSITLTPEESFGSKDSKHIQMIPATKFKEQKIQPYPGLRLDIDGSIGTIKTAGGGRVLVDFNHPLAGKHVVYDITIKQLILDKMEQIKAILKLGLAISAKDVNVIGDSATITVLQEMPVELAEIINKKIIALCGVKAIAWKKSATS